LVFLGFISLLRGIKIVIPRNIAEEAFRLPRDGEPVPYPPGNDTRQPKAPLCKGGCHIADFRQYDWGIVTIRSIPPSKIGSEEPIFATSLYTREAPLRRDWI